MPEKQEKDHKLSTILREFAALDANKIEAINNHPDGFLAGLKEIGADTAKHIVAWNLFIRASAGDLRATKLFLEQIGEDESKKYQITTEEIPTNLTIDQLQKMPLSKLKLLERKFEQKKEKK
jgi:hypothetical protein